MNISNLSTVALFITAFNVSYKRVTTIEP